MDKIKKILSRRKILKNYSILKEADDFLKISILYKDIEYEFSITNSGENTYYTDGSVVNCKVDNIDRYFGDANHIDETDILFYISNDIPLSNLANDLEEFIKHTYSCYFKVSKMLDSIKALDGDSKNLLKIMLR